MATIEFFYDFTSPYSYLAASQIRELAIRTGSGFQPKPFVLGAVFKAVGTDKIQAEVPAKAALLVKDLAAWARDYGIPFQWPDMFPVNSVKASRAVLAVADAALSWKLVRRIYLAYWGENVDIAQPDQLARLIAEVGLNPEEILALTETQDIKAKLRANTDDAIARGAFGAPTIFVGDQLFFGNDRLMFVERTARGERVYG
jgi:2-hydroxychromene-2-carboxylate isomerase